MNKQSIFRLYLSEHANDFFLFFAMIGIFTTTLCLYGTYYEVVLYTAFLCFVLFITVEVISICAFFKKHRALQTELQNLPHFTNTFPTASTLSEQDLQEIIFRMEQLLNLSLTEQQTKEQDALDFYTTWIHQIKTPISVIKMTLQSEDTAEHRLLSSELFRIEQYVDMVLCYLRLGSESSDLVFRQCNLDDILKECIHKYAPQFIARKIRLVYRPAQQMVLTDEKWLAFIIEQILSNSIKYTPQGTITITVTPEHILQISDTGIGIAPEDLPRIFEKGFTGYNGRSDKKATGLGLYLCRKAAQKLGHTIAAESVIGEGTTISINLNHAALGVE